MILFDLISKYLLHISLSREKIAGAHFLAQNQTLHMQRNWFPNGSQVDAADLSQRLRLGRGVWGYWSDSVLSLLFHHAFYVFVLRRLSYSKHSSERIVYFCLFVKWQAYRSLHSLCNGSKWFQRDPKRMRSAHCAGLSASMALSACRPVSRRHIAPTQAYLIPIYLSLKGLSDR